MPHVGAAALSADPLVVEAHGRALTISLVEMGLACCGLEVAAARSALRPEAMPPEVTVAPAGPRGGTATNVIIVAGTVTAAAAADLRRAVLDVAAPRRVVAFGACACSGGPYWDSYAVVPGLGSLLDVDVHIPGCPPRPEALWAGVAHLLDLDAPDDRRQPQPGGQP